MNEYDLIIKCVSSPPRALGRGRAGKTPRAFRNAIVTVPRLGDFELWSDGLRMWMCSAELRQRAQVLQHRLDKRICRICTR